MSLHRHPPASGALLVVLVVSGASTSAARSSEAAEGKAPVGLAFGVLGSFGLGVLLAEFKEGIRSNFARSVDARTQGADERAAPGGGPNNE